MERWAKMLQWGHDFSVMERAGKADSSDIAFLMLQWGHDFSVMESNRSRSITYTDYSFNGAMTFQSWKAGTSDEVHSGLNASMGP